MVHAIDLLEVCPIAMDQKLHYYYLDWTSNQGTWQGSILSKLKNVTSPQNLRNLRTFYPRIPNGGWHFSYMGGADQIIKKMTSIVEGNELIEKSGGRLVDKKHIEEVMKTGKDLYGRKGVLEEQFYPCDIETINLPYIKEFVKKYPQFLKPKD